MKTGGIMNIDHCFCFFAILPIFVLAFAVMMLTSQACNRNKRDSIKRLERIFSFLASIFRVALGISATIYALGIICQKNPMAYQIIVRSAFAFCLLLILHLMIRTLNNLRQRK